MRGDQVVDGELAERLRQSDERYRMLFDGNPVPTWVVDVETLRFVDVNRAMIEAYGYSRDEFLALHVADLKPPGEQLAAVETVRDAPLGTVRHVGVRRHRHKDGTLLEMDITLNAMRIDDRLCVLGTAIDVTRARLVEAELRQAQKLEAIGRLAGGIAHDFNNVLAVLQSNTELALEQLPPDHAACEVLLEARAAAVRGAGLTRRLLTFSRKEPRVCAPLALNPSIVGIEAMLARIIGEDIAVSTSIAPDLGVIDADPCEVEQILMNLVVNARDAMPDGGRLRIETSNQILDATRAAMLGVAPGSYVTLSVTDTGCGMAPGVRARIFEPFFTTKDVDRGTGLGLAIVFNIVKQAGGSIAVDTAPGRGTTFRIYWPRIDISPAAQVPAPTTLTRGTGTVLVAEDDAQLARVFWRYLTGWGYRVLLAATGAEALAASRTHAGPIDILLTDLVMPGGIDGRTLSERILAERPETQVVFMSGYTEHPAIRRTRIAPGELFVPKPFSAAVLSQTLARALDRRTPSANVA
ncbi:MAG TPA: ATP-binding protein [Kofleriaceae bacterium]|jgi:PAS domain S-box-containing protein